MNMKLDTKKNAHRSTHQQHHTSALDAPKDFYDCYRVSIRFRGRVIATQSPSPEVLQRAIAAKTGYNDELTKQQVTNATEALEESRAQSEELLEASYNIFLRDERGLYLETRQVKAGLRECFSTQNVFVAKARSKQIFQHALFVDGEVERDRIYLGVTEPTGVIERPIHVSTPQGPRNALKGVEYVEHAEVTFEVRVMRTAATDKRHIGRKELNNALYQLQDDGLGADRSQGEGTFDVVVFEQLDTE